MRHHLAGGSSSAVMTPARCRDAAHASLTRVTKEGRTLTYCLTVIQQPERARACGSGAKSSADRRPVDPPPVVELRIFEGKNQSELVDVTFNYNANFFLFTTLEVARPMAHGRMQPQIQQIPVLTGMPVSGMAYLDRPSLAGYFIFPDLSVRHEGRYRLSFNLYEETKEARDADGESSDQTKPSVPSSPTSPSAPTASFDWRLEVKSDPFTVFSAKKFPGLAESTSLSRAVAEQGCRVRIRRDVRMRRRDNKPTGDYEGSQEGEYVRAGRTPSIQESRDRSRSLSNESVGRHPYGLERRMSGEYPGAYPTSRPQGYLNFGGPPRNQLQAPPPRFAQPAPPAPMPYQSALAPRPHHGHFRQPAPSPQDSFARPLPPQPAPPTQNAANRLPSLQPPPPHNALDRPSQPPRLPPLIEPPRHQPDLNPLHPPQNPSQTMSQPNGASIMRGRKDPVPYTVPGFKLAPIQIKGHSAWSKERKRTTLEGIRDLIDKPDTPSAQPQPDRLHPGRPGSGPLPPDALVPDDLETDHPDASIASLATLKKSINKRTHGAAFDPRSGIKTAPLHNGMRPEDPDDAGDDDEPGNSDKTPSYESNMHYARADGTLMRIRSPPPP